MSTRDPRTIMNWPGVPGMWMLAEAVPAAWIAETLLTPADCIQFGQVGSAEVDVRTSREAGASVLGVAARRSEPQLAQYRSASARLAPHCVQNAKDVGIEDPAILYFNARRPRHVSACLRTNSPSILRQQHGRQRSLSVVM